MPSIKKIFRSPLFVRWAFFFGVATLIGLINSSTAHTAHLMSGDDEPFIFPFIYEMTGAYGVFLLLPFLLPWMRRFRITPRNWPLYIFLHLLVLAVFGFLHTTFMTISRAMIFSLFDLGHYDYGDVDYRFLMEFHKQFLIYWLIYGIVTLWSYYQNNREREKKTAALELQTSQLAHQLSHAQLQSLKAQLQPHFLFNTLNMISSFMYDDLPKADSMIAKLSRLLRLSLDNNGKQKIPLSQEIEFLRLYVDIMLARFQDKLSVRINLHHGTETALVPSLMLQPIVENAIKHNDPRRADRTTVEVLAEKIGDRLILRITDNGPGINGDLAATLQKGVGLSNTFERLKQLYGAACYVDMNNLPSGGLKVEISIPYESAAMEEPV